MSLESKDDSSIADLSLPFNTLSPGKKRTVRGKPGTLRSTGSVRSTDSASKSAKSMTSKTSKLTKLTSSPNRIDDKTEEFMRHEEIYRKFRIAVRQTEQFVKQINDKSEERIYKRSIGQEAQAKVDHDIAKSSDMHAKTHEKYIHEVDKAIEDRAQLRAVKQYHITHINKLLPEWCRVVDDVLELIKGNGHNNKLQWRSKARSLLHQSLDRMESDPNAKESIVRVRRLALEINAHKAQRVITILNDIKQDYISSLEGASELGQHNSELKKIGLQLKNQPVPLTRKEWSSDLDSTLKSRSEFEKSSFLSTGLALADGSHKTLEEKNTRHHQRFDSSHCTTDTTAAPTLPDTTEVSSVFGGADLENSICSSVGLPQEDKYLSHREEPFAVTTLPLLRYPPADVKTPTAVMKLFRDAASRGQLRECWGLFNCLYGEFVVANDPEKFAQTTLKSAPTLDVFKLLFTAFKNSISYSYVDAKNMFLAMKHVNIEPDVALYNILIRSCERRGAWRRALAYVREMQDTYSLVPNTNTYATLMDCCRHAQEDPATIFETLRNEDLPRKFCYQAASCNAGNRLSHEATNTTFCDMYGSGIDSHSVAMNRKYGEGRLDVSSTVANHLSLELEHIKDRAWDDFRDSVRPHLNWKSPAKHLTGLSAHSFNKQLARVVVPSEKRIAATTGLLHNYDSTFSGIRGIDLEKSEVMNESYIPSPPRGSAAFGSSSLLSHSSASYSPKP